MDNQTQQEQNYYVTIFPKERQDNAVIPRAANLINHVLCRFPRYLVRCCRVKVTRRPEEQTGERDKRKCLRYGPGDAKRFEEV